jgi:hypothetical protein
MTSEAFLASAPFAARRYCVPERVLQPVRARACIAPTDRRARNPRRR